MAHSPSSSSSELPVQDELLLIERVFIRIGSASTDEALEAELNKFLPPIILKLASPVEAVRKKVMELLIHINRRVKDLKQIQLPVEPLLTQYQDPSATSFVTNFSIIYIKMGYPRLDVNKQVELLPTIINCLEGKPQQHQESLLHLIMPVFAHLKFPETPEKTASLFTLRERENISKLLVDFMQDVLLLPYGATPLTHQRPPDNREQQDGPPVPGVPAGMSISSFKRVCGEVTWKPEELENIKVSIVKFLSSEVLSPASVALPLIVASSDTRFSVANAADMSLRRLDTTFDFNNGAVIAAIYVLFLGTLTPKDKTPFEKFKNPANTRIRLKLMPFLLKSKEATNYAPLALKVFYECVWGPYSNSKLKQQGVTFLHHISFTANKEKLMPVGSLLFNGVVKVIEEERNDARLRSLAYGALAKLSLKLPNLLISHTSQLHYLQTLMDALVKEEGDVLLAVQEALSMVAPVCKQLTPTSQDQLCILLSEHVLHQNPQLRRTAVHYAGSVFSSDHVASRFILMLATGDSQDDIRLEARRQLYKSISEDKDGTPRFQTPPFTAMVEYVIERVNALPKTKWLDVVNQPVPFTVTVMEQILLYLEHCISVEASEKKRADGQLYWENSPLIGKFIAKIIEQHRGEALENPEKAESNPLGRYIGFAEIAANAWSALALESILRVVAVAPKQLVGKYSGRMDWIKKYIIRGGHYGEVAAHLFGLVAGQFEDEQQFVKAVQPILKIKDLRIESQESCILAQGHSFCYKLYALRKKDPMLMKNWAFYESVVFNLVKMIVSDLKTLQLSCLIALGEIARQAPLPLPVEDENDEKPSLMKLLLTLQSIYCNKKLSSKVREQAIMTSGYLCVGHHDFPLKVEVTEGLLGLAKETNEVEIHFAVGEALTDCVLGPDSPSARNAWIEGEGGAEEMQWTEQSKDDEFSVCEEKEKDSIEMMEKDQKSPMPSSSEPMETDDVLDVESEEGVKSEDREASAVKGSLEWLLLQLLQNYIPQSHPSCRQASCIWLLAVLKRCRTKSTMQKYLPNIQQAFMDLLGENNDLIQDAASKGLGVVYECCSEETRQSMVEGLVRTLTEGKKPTLTVTSDTQIFQEGELGKAPSGSQLSTYKELCSLATDLNQPELIYKFMNLANHNAIWNSKKGAAFGFSTLATQAGAQLEPYLPQIIPKLYRYQHDPTPRIQQPMAVIWNSLVKDNSKTICKYYEPILLDILSNLTHTTWRVRESCCIALSDLLRRQSVTEAGNHISEIWKTLFRVRDDIKESVRLAAEKTLQTLSKSCIKVCDTPGHESKKILEEVLPVLLTIGITSSVSEVRAVSIQTLVKLCRSGGAMVRPHLGTLVPALLEALSGLEHQAITYTAVRMDDESREKLDMARVAAAKSTPIMDTLNYVLQFIDEEVLEMVVGGVIDVLKRSIGLSSRAGAAHVVVTLTHTCPGPLEKYTGKILTALVNGLGDRNSVVRKVFANAIGNLVKTAKVSSIDKLLAKLQSWYLEKEEDSAKVSAALALRSMHLQNGDVMKNHASNAMPLVFLAMHAQKNIDGTDPTGVEIWEEIWTENTPGTEAGVRLYLNEIISICDLALQSSNWATKAQAGKAFSTVSKKLGPTLTEDQTRRLFSLLFQGLQGRTWAGKEEIVGALSDFALSTKSLLSYLKDTETDELLLDKVISVLTREAKKEKMDYKIRSIKALTQVLSAYRIDRFEEVFEICLPYLSLDKERMEDADTDTQRSSKEESLRWDLVDEMVHSLGRAWPATKETQEKFSEQVVEMLSTSVTRVTRKTQLSIVGALRSFWAEHFMLKGLPETLDHVLLGALLHYTCKIFNYCLGVAKFYRSSVLVSRVRTDLLSSVEEAKRDTQPDVQALASSVYKILIEG
ncbi:Proteasome-associated protein ECM29-like protein [Armadillidium nasatum]|uniref:Proteasome-associated protein ECM29-like protein n=1 Tax=Armadillidium nasatum TaxID=96803 RepID=A0A5N5T7J9_9CRUS|nr:Proteasome-associated protein ECM29-like protein [Armadillidium nasatum]